MPDSHTPFFLGEFVAADGGDHPLCPRTRLRSVLAQAAAQGMAVKLGFEYEFFVFDETPHSVRAKGYRDLKPFTPGQLRLLGAARVDRIRSVHRADGLRRARSIVRSRRCIARPAPAFGKVRSRSPTR